MLLRLMEVTFLGTGTSQGVPMIAHNSEGCDLSNPKNWRTRSSVHVEMDGFHVQVDAAPEFRLQCIRNQIEQLDVFILTHGHADHILGMDDLRRFCDLKGFSALPVYSTPTGLQRVREVFPYAIRDKPEQRGYAAFNIQEMPETLELPGGWIRRTLLPHGRINVLGLVFEERSSGAKFVYYNDCKVVGPEAQALAAGAHVVVLDGLRPQVHPSHMSIEEALEVAAQISAPSTYLTHMTFQVDHARWQAQMPENVYLAWDGLQLSI